MTPQLAKLLLDAFQAAAHVRTFSVGRTLQDYLTDVFLRSALERQLEIVGEALNQARSLQSDLHKQIDHLNEWIGLRHRIAHAYDRLDHEIVWDTVVEDTPNLLHNLALLLNEAPPIDTSATKDTPE
jgi:uncharacterized protein with HEPN domain